MRTWMMSLVLVASVTCVARAADPETWTAPDGSFSIAFPTKPTKMEQKLETGPVITFVSGTYSLVYSENAALAQATPEIAEFAISAARDSMVKAAKGKLVSDKKIKYDDKYVGHDIVIQLEGKMVAHSRIYLIENRFYVISATQPEDALKDKKDAAFMESFKVGKK